jgi:hypothetical protein
MGHEKTMAKSKVAVRRSSQMWLAAYYLARFGRPGQLPPETLKTDSWSEAYDLFFESLADGRDRQAFRNSLKNARDVFDAHVGTERVGWRDTTKTDRPPGTLGAEAARVLDEHRDSSHTQIWRSIAGLVGIDGVSGDGHVTPAAAENVDNEMELLPPVRSLNDILVEPPGPAPTIRVPRSSHDRIPSVRVVSEV